jgi:hypothetical protein
MAADSKYIAALQRTKSFSAANEGIIAGSISRYVVTVVPEALIDTLRAIASVELFEQVAANNEPSAIIVDGKDSRVGAIASAIKRVRFIFADIKLMIQCIREAYEILQNVTRLESPAKNEIVARQHYHVYVNRTNLGLAPGALSKLGPATVNARSVIRLVGPLVNYGRRMYWKPVGGSKSGILQARQTARGPRLTYANKYTPRWKPYSQKYLRRLVREAYGPGQQAAEALGTLKGQKPRPGRTEGTTKIARRLLRANQIYKQLYISDAWIEYPPAARWGKKSRDARVPTISIRIARGKTKLSSFL